MEAKIEGFFQSLELFLQQVDEKLNECDALKEQISDHQDQKRICSLVQVAQLNIECINEQLQKLLVFKLLDKIQEKKDNLRQIQTWFRDKSDMFQKKLDKCLIVSDLHHQDKCAEYLTWMSEICFILKQHALKLEFHVLKICKNEIMEDASAPNVDESDSIFHHQTWSQDAPLSFKIDDEDLEKVKCKLL